jgi:hypothetical protein
MAASEIDIWKTAKVLVDGCGVDAVTLASMQPDQVRKQGSFDGHAIWTRFRKAIEELLEKNSHETATCNGSGVAKHSKLTFEVDHCRGASYSRSRIRACTSRFLETMSGTSP